jgi:NADPH2:quinone reductase
MKAIEIPNPGPPEVLRLTDRPSPSPGPGEVLIAVEAAGVNRPDLMQREGRYPPPPGTTDIPGMEVAGRISASVRRVLTVTRVGVRPDVARGRRSLRARRRRRLRELCVAPGVQCLPVPTGRR